jgi:hypothetical protein
MKKDKVHEELRDMMGDNLLPHTNAIYLFDFQKQKKRLLREKKMEQITIDGEVFYKIL